MAGSQRETKKTKLCSCWKGLVCRLATSVRTSRPKSRPSTAASGGRTAREASTSTRPGHSFRPTTACLQSWDGRCSPTTTNASSAPTTGLWLPTRTMCSSSATKATDIKSMPYWASTRMPRTSPAARSTPATPIKACRPCGTTTMSPRYPLAFPSCL